MVKKIFGLVEDYLSLVLRVVLALAVGGILIYALVSALSGYVMSNKEASLRSGASGAEYADGAAEGADATAASGWICGPASVPSYVYDRWYGAW